MRSACRTDLLVSLKGGWVPSGRAAFFCPDVKRTVQLKQLLVVLERKYSEKTEMIVQNFFPFSPISCCLCSGNLLDYISASNVKEDRLGRGPRSEIP